MGEGSEGVARGARVVEATTRHMEDNSNGIRNCRQVVGTGDARLGWQSTGVAWHRSAIRCGDQPR